MTGSNDNWWRTRLLVATLLASLFWGGLVPLFLDLFGVKTAAAFHSESIFLRFIAGPWYKSTAQNEITVVLIDDNYLEQIGSSWPMSYVEQALLLSDILDLEPRAVFLDLLYRHRHGDDAEIEQLVETIERAANKTPIFIPYLVNDVEGDSCQLATHSFEKTIQEDSVIEEMQNSGAIRTYIGWKGCDNRYPAFILGDKEFRTPAFALYEDIFTHPENEKRLSNDAFRDPMMIRWGTGVSSEHKSALQKAGIDCKSLDSWTEKVEYLFFSQLKTAIQQTLTSASSERGQRESCTYTDTLHATWFRGVSPENHEYLKKMIENRIVLVGTQIDGIHDTILSPVNGKLPGVYLFAMALDNYLEYGPDYFKTIKAKFALELFVLWFISFSMGAIFHERKTNIWFAFLVCKVTIPVIISLVVAMIMGSFKYAPMDWIGVSLLSFFANPIKNKVWLKNEGKGYSFGGEPYILGGIWEDITSWLCFLLRRLFSSVQIVTQRTKKLPPSIRRISLCIRKRDEGSEK
ncbi:MAG TPA: hypothetical protein DDY32_14900 [Desulfobulbaceae bacterium]|nr:hypothetical protein [Desulfobulbaceae bacterium]